MEISRTTMKKLLLLIAFAALAFTAFQWIDGVAAALRFLLNLLAPFVAGGAVAFVLNVPMRAIETRLTPRGKAAGSRRVRSLIRVASLLLTFLFVVLVLLVVVNLREARAEKAAARRGA